MMTQSLISDLEGFSWIWKRSLNHASTTLQVEIIESTSQKEIHFVELKAIWNNILWFLSRMVFPSQESKKGENFTEVLLIKVIHHLNDRIMIKIKYLTLR